MTVSTKNRADEKSCILAHSLAQSGFFSRGLHLYGQGEFGPTLKKSGFAGDDFAVCAVPGPRTGLGAGAGSGENAAVRRESNSLPPMKPETTPVEIDRSTETEVRILWADGETSVFPARTVRLLCPCAECVDEASGVRVLDPASVPEDVRAVGARLVGRYGVEFSFSDGHDLGIFTFESLRRYAGEKMWGAGGER